jgi:hypothetical protein
MSKLLPVALHPSRSVVDDETIGRDVRGVYGIFFAEEERVLERCGYLDFDDRMPVVVDGAHLLYVGASVDPLRRRVLSHLTGNTKGSSLRMTLGALFADDLDLDPISNPRRNYYEFGFGENRLSDWIIGNTSVGFYASDDPYGAERRILTSVAVPLNIDWRKKHRYSRFLMNLRGVVCGRAARWPGRTR